LVSAWFSHLNPIRATFMGRRAVCKWSQDLTQVLAHKDEDSVCCDDKMRNCHEDKVNWFTYYKLCITLCIQYTCIYTDKHYEYKRNECIWRNFARCDTRRRLEPNPLTIRPDHER
jgi:hypothetical protein